MKTYEDSNINEAYKEVNNANIKMLNNTWDTRIIVTEVLRPNQIDEYNVYDATAEILGNRWNSTSGDEIYMAAYNFMYDEMSEDEDIDDIDQDDTQYHSADNVCASFCALIAEKIYGGQMSDQLAAQYIKSIYPIVRPGMPE